MPKPSQLELDYQYQDMLAQQNKARDTTTQEQADAARAQVKSGQAATGSGQFIQTAPIPAANSLRQKAKAQKYVKRK